MAEVENPNNTVPPHKKQLPSSIPNFDSLEGFSTDGNDDYSTFKKLCDQRFGLQSLCLCEQKAISCFGGAKSPKDVGESHHFAGYVRNVAMKLNVRLCHSNHVAKGLNELTLKHWTESIDG